MAERLHDHHILHYRKPHESHDDTKWIRRKGGLIVGMVLDVHDDLHRNTPGVPVIDIYMARRVKGIMLREGIPKEPLQAIDNYCFAITEASMHPKTYPLERTVGEMAIEAVRLQIPFIEAGTIPGRSLVLDRS